MGIERRTIRERDPECPIRAHVFGETTIGRSRCPPGPVLLEEDAAENIREMELAVAYLEDHMDG